jgi:hypothetical protein
MSGKKLLVSLVALSDDETSGDMFGCGLLNKMHLYLTEFHFSFKILMQFF